jgi:hypothetical protein
MLDSIFFSENGYVVSEKLLDTHELENIREIYNLFLENKIEVGNARSDLSGLSNAKEKTEKITQIMRPSYFYPELAQFAVYTKALNLAKSLLGKPTGLKWRTKELLPAGLPSMKCSKKMVVCGLCQAHIN